ncbi:uncharacterized protein LOC129409429 isoform X2 [Boleophthalmus pectinirostris]|uniref:uncharacterized protein LOC129409429 isoform X2 n=1 Tax=Boleophthalmus pectinirostris TaxID=150288 RepID=UPI00243036DE|nr:uncharacterized protein LOC129409429 isoform X2 [Boleophthalmus pectinirostris]
MSNTDNKESTELTEEMTSKSEAIKDHMKDVHIAGQSKSQLMLRKLKSVILKKRKIDALKEGLNTNCVVDNELGPKRIKNDMAPATTRNINDTCTQESAVGDQNDPNSLSADPLFAHALGLTPKSTQNIQTDTKAVHRTYSSGAKEIFATKDRKPQSLSSPKGTRLKMLKKHQNLSADQVKKKSPFQVSPLNGSSRLLHAQRLWGEARQKPPVSPEDKVEQNKMAPGDPKRSWYRRKFCLSRTIENRDKTVQVTRHWKEDYDFNLDSRFTADPKDKTIVRSLHGPWDSSIHDSNEEVQLIVHMWIGLFYSRSTARFFHFDPDITFPAPDGVKGSKEKRPDQKASDTAVHGPLLNVADKPEAQVLDLSKSKNSVTGTEPVSLNSSLKLSSVEISNENPEAKTQELMVKTQVPEELNTLNPQGLQTTHPIQWYLNMMPAAGVSPFLNYVSMPVNNGNSSEINHLFIPVWNGITNGMTNPNMLTNDAHTPSVASAESGESQQIEDAPENLTKRRELPIRRQESSKRQGKRTQRNTYLSAPNKKESNENKMHAKDLPNSKALTDRCPTNGDVNAVRCSNLLEIKKKYMEKLKAASSQVNQKIDSSSPQNDREVGQCILLKKLLRQDTIAETSKLQFLLKKTAVCENSAKTCNENMWINQKTKETACAENLSGHRPLNIICVDPLVELKKQKTSHLENSAIVSEQYVANDGLFKGQDINMRTQDLVVENPPTDGNRLGLSQDEYVKTIESPVINTVNILHHHPTDEAENNKYCDVNTCTGMNTSLEDKSLEQTSDSTNEVDQQGFEHMEVVPSDSSEVTAPTSTYSDSTNYDGHSQHREQLVAGSKVNHPSDLVSELDDRCPTPTIDEQPFVYTSQLKSNSDVNDLDKVCPDTSQKEPSTSLTPVMDETLVEKAPKEFNCDTMANVGNQSDIELRTLRTLKCLDEYLSTLQNRNQSLLNSEDTPNSSLCLKKRTSMKSTFSTGDSCPPEVKSESSQYLPFSDVLAGKLNKSNVNGEEDGLKSNQSSPGVAGRPSQIVKEQGHISLSKVRENPDCNAQSKPVIRFSIKRTRQGGFVCNGSVFEAHHQNENRSDTFVLKKCKEPDNQELQNTQTPTTSTQPVESHESKLQVLKHDHKTGDEDLLNYSTSFVDSKTNKITDDSLGVQGSLSCTVSNSGRKASSFLEKVSKRCMQDDPTQSSMDNECLIFLDQMKQLLKRKQDQGAQCDQSNQSPSSCPITVQFSHIQEQADVLDDIMIPSAFINQKISVDMSDKKQEELKTGSTQQISSKPQPHGVLEQPGVSAITAQCTRLYRDIMNKICSETKNASLLRDLHKTDSEDSTANSSNYFDFCSQMKREMDDCFHNSLNSVVKKSCKSKNRFFLLVTSDDDFFNRTQAHLEAEGHIAVQPSDFFIRENSSSPLLVIIRNEDIAGHIFEVPHLLELRKSPVVQFAGIDEPDDVVNLTYQELFIKGGFVMFDRGAVESLSPGDMKKILEILQKLGQTGRWKWVLHYRDSRRLKENARLCPKAKDKTDLLNKCKEDGLLDILPYHECDLVSRQEPNYLQCLCHQQVQNISSRYPVFVTDSETDGVFEKNGIMTMTVNTFLMGLLSKTINGIT